MHLLAAAGSACPQRPFLRSEQPVDCLNTMAQANAAYSSQKHSFKAAAGSLKDAPLTKCEQQTIWKGTEQIRCKDKDSSPSVRYPYPESYHMACRNIVLLTSVWSRRRALGYRAGGCSAHAEAAAALLCCQG